jgi:hypothetical protein
MAHSVDQSRQSRGACHREREGLFNDRPVGSGNPIKLIQAGSDRVRLRPILASDPPPEVI